MQAKSVEDGGDEEPELPDERLHCEVTPQEDLQTQGQGLQSKRHGPATNRVGTGRRQEDMAAGVQDGHRPRRSRIHVEDTAKN